MRKNKSVNELLSSIVSLINEAKNEYEFVKNKDLPKKIFPEIEKTQTKEKTIIDNESNIISQPEINSFENEKDSFNNWKDINFKKTIKKYNLKDFQNNLSYPSNKKIEVEFNMLLDSWLKKNLNKLIELEISNYIKNKQS